MFTNMLALRARCGDTPHPMMEYPYPVLGGGAQEAELLSSSWVLILLFTPIPVPLSPLPLLMDLIMAELPSPEAGSQEPTLCTSQPWQCAWAMSTPSLEGSKLRP